MHKNTKIHINTKDANKDDDIPSLWLLKLDKSACTQNRERTKKRKTHQYVNKYVKLKILTQIGQNRNNNPSLWLLKLDKSACTQTREREQNANVQILKILHKYWGFIRKYWKFCINIENIEFWYKTKNTHLPQVEKFYLKSFKPFYAQKWEFWTI